MEHNVPRELNIRVEALTSTPVERRAVEVVERQGVGHPDTVRDSAAEAASGALCRL